MEERLRLESVLGKRVASVGTVGFREVAQCKGASWRTKVSKLEKNVENGREQRRSVGGARERIIAWVAKREGKKTTGGNGCKWVRR